VKMGMSFMKCQLIEKYFRNFFPFSTRSAITKEIAQHRDGVISVLD
jgi:hypothetical protein